MPDVLVRDVPIEAVAELDRRASKLGLSRSESLRREWVSRVEGSFHQQTSMENHRPIRSTIDMVYPKETLLTFFDHTADDAEFELPPRDGTIGRIPTFDH